MRKETIIGITGNETIIGAGVRVKGNLSGEHDIIIDGILTGNIKTKGSITAGVNAIIKGNLGARDVSIAGQLEGDIKAAGQVTIAETGRIKGNIASHNLAIAAGGVFVGNSIMSLSELVQPTSIEEATTESES